MDRNVRSHGRFKVPSPAPVKAIDRLRREKDAVIAQMALQIKNEKLLTQRLIWCLLSKTVGHGVTVLITAQALGEAQDLRVMLDVKQNELNGNMMLTASMKPEPVDASADQVDAIAAA